MKFFKLVHKYISDNWRQWTSLCHTLFSLKKFSFNMKISGSQTGIPQLNNVTICMWEHSIKVWSMYSLFLTTCQTSWTGTLMKTTSKLTNRSVSKFLFLSDDESRACLPNTFLIHIKMMEKVQYMCHFNNTPSLKTFMLILFKNVVGNPKRQRWLQRTRCSDHLHKQY